MQWQQTEQYLVPHPSIFAHGPLIIAKSLEQHNYLFQHQHFGAQLLYIGK